MEVSRPIANLIGPARDIPRDGMEKQIGWVLGLTAALFALAAILDHHFGWL